MLRLISSQSIGIALSLASALYAGLVLQVVSVFFVWQVLLVPVGLGIALLTIRSDHIPFVLFGFGSISWLTATWWLPEGVNAMNPDYPILGWVLWVALAAFNGIPFLVAGFFGSRLGWCGRGAPTPRPTAVAALISLAVEIWPSRMPGSFVTSLYQVPVAVQMCAVGGGVLLSWLLYATGFQISRGVFPRLCLRRLLGGLLPFGVALVYGIVVLYGWSDTLSNARLLTVGLIQPNLPLEHRETPNSSGNSFEGLLEQTEILLHEHPDLDLVVWPEIPVYFAPQHRETQFAELSRLLNNRKTPLLADGDLYTNETVYGRIPYYNVVQLYRGSAVAESEYRKMLLVPFGEYLPFESWLSQPPFEDLFSSIRMYVPGERISLISLSSDVVIGTPVCLEALHSEHVSAMVTHGAQLLINLTNDAYFGDTPGKDVHLAMAALRAVENRRTFVRVANSGITTAFDPRGVEIASARIPTFSKGASVIRVPLIDEGDGVGVVVSPSSTGMLLVVVYLFVCLGRSICGGSRGHR